MIFENKKRILRHQYTIIELLVVLAIVGLLTGMTVSGIKGALARQGATGAVRTLANKISLAQSFAVSKNRYVALLVPDHDDINTDLSGNNDGYVVLDDADGTSYWNGTYISCFRKNRLCYVTKDTSVSPTVYKFDRWVDGYEWQTLPSKTVAFISSESSVDDSTPAKVTLVPDPTDPSAVADDTSTALIFKPSGALVNTSYSGVVIRIFRAAYVPGTSTDHFVWQGTEDKNKGWKIYINGFTGRSRFGLGGEKLSE